MVIPDSGSTGTTYRVDGGCSSDEEDPTESLHVRWDWEDDGTWDTSYSITKTESHRYGTTGTKTIRLEVKDTGGLLGSMSDTIAVIGVNAAPTASFTVTPGAGTTETEFQFDASGCADVEDSVDSLAVRWDFENDGVWDTEYSMAKASTHRYDTAGIKTIALEAKDTGGLLGSASGTVTVGPSPPPPGFVLVQPGTFVMGSPEDELCRYPDERRHEVTLTRALYVSAREVTQAEWLAVMGWNDSYFQGPDRPVEEVTWFDAGNFCNELSEAEGLRPAYSISEATFDGNHIIDASVGWFQNANGYRLLTESEWEYACRAGSQTAYCNGGTIECECGSEPNLAQVGWYCADLEYQTHDVGLKNPNGWGVYDMHGNVWEWCWDWYGAYPSGPVVDPTGSGASLYRVIRGGGWNYGAAVCRSANRYGSVRGARGNDLGFRVARTAP